MSTTLDAKERTAAALSREQVMWQDPERMHGTPCFTGTRVPIESLFDYLEAGDSLTEFLENYPGVTKEQALSALRLGKDQLLSRNDR